MSGSSSETENPNDDNDDRRIKYLLNVQDQSKNLTFFERLMGRTPDDLLTFCKELSTSLYKHTGDVEGARTMFEKIVEFMQLPNHAGNNATKEECLNEILQFQSPQLPSEELAFQLVKQTRRTPELFWERNVWNLFGLLVDRIKPFTENEAVLKWMMKNSAATAKTNADSMIRLMAFGVWQALKGKGSAIDYDDLVDQIQSTEGVPKVVGVQIYCYAQPMKIYVGDDAIVPEAISQAIWMKGLKPKDEYTLYGELPQEGYLLIGHGTSLVRMASTKKGADFSRFVLRKKFSRLTADEKRDGHSTDESFFASKGRYLRGKYEHVEVIATQLCLFQILAEEKGHYLFDRKELLENIQKYFPQEAFSSRTSEFWMREVLSSYSFVKEVSDVDAKRWFLQLLRALCCEKCIECSAVPDTNFPADTGGEPVVLKMTCFGLHFFVTDIEEDPQDDKFLSLLLMIDYCHLVDLNVECDKLLVKAIIGGLLMEFSLNTNEGKKIQEAVDAHFDSKDREYFANQLSAPRSHSIGFEVPPARVPLSATSGETRCVWSPTPRDAVGLAASHSPVTQSLEVSALSQGILRMSRHHDEGPSNQNELSFEKGDIIEDKYVVECTATGHPKIIFAESLNSGDRVTLKFLKREEISAAAQLYRKLKQCEHVCKFHDVLETEHGPCLVLERGNITLEKKRKQNMSDAQKRDAIEQILKGVNEIHERGIVHGDIKPLNIMFFESMQRWKIIDLDASGIRDVSKTRYFTYQYAAPEQIRSMVIIGHEDTFSRPPVDIYACGVVAFELCAENGRSFYEDEDKNAICAAHAKGDYQPDFSAIQSENARSLIKKMLKNSPSQRITAKDALAEGFLREGTASSQIVHRAIQSKDMNVTVNSLSLSELHLCKLAVGLQIQNQEDGTDLNGFENAENAEQPSFRLSVGKKYDLFFTLTFDSDLASLVRTVKEVSIRLHHNFKKHPLEIEILEGNQNQKLKVKATLDTTVPEIQQSLSYGNEADFKVLDILLAVEKCENELFFVPMQIRYITSPSQGEDIAFQRPILPEWTDCPHVCQDLKDSVLFCGFRMR